VIERKRERVRERKWREREILKEELVDQPLV